MQVFCLEHRTYKSHECPKPEPSSRKVVVCEICSTSIETTGRDEKEEKAMLERHEKSGECDPSKKKKPTCPVRRCKEVLTFSNTSTCKTCQLNFCLKHRFPIEHACKQRLPSSTTGAKERWSDKFLAALGARIGNDCAKNGGRTVSPPGTSHPVKACWDFIWFVHFVDYNLYALLPPDVILEPMLNSTRWRFMVLYGKQLHYMKGPIRIWHLSYRWKFSETKDMYKMNHPDSTANSIYMHFAFMHLGSRQFSLFLSPSGR